MDGLLCGPSRPLRAKLVAFETSLKFLSCTTELSKPDVRHRNCALSQTRSIPLCLLLYLLTGRCDPFAVSATMYISLSTLALLGASLLPLAAFAHNIQLTAHSRECFHEVLHKDDKMTVTFQVGDREFGGAGNLELDFWVSALYGQGHMLAHLYRRLFRICKLHEQSFPSTVR